MRKTIFSFGKNKSPQKIQNPGREVVETDNLCVCWGGVCGLSGYLSDRTAQRPQQFQA